MSDQVLHSCYDCEWECLDRCSLKIDDTGNRPPVFDGLTDCKDFKENTGLISARNEVAQILLDESIDGAKLINAIKKMYQACRPGIGRFKKE